MSITLGSLGSGSSLVGTPTASTLATKSIVGNDGVSVSSSSTEVTISADVTNIPDIVTIGGISVSGAEAVRLLVNTSSVVSNQDVYTVPANKRLWLQFVHPMLPSGGTANVITTSIKVSGNYYPLRPTVSTTSVGTPSTLYYIAEAGEKLAISTSQTTATNIWFKGLLFDDTNSLKTAKLLSLSTGDNTLYTCPSVHTSYIVTLSENSGNMIYGVFYSNISGGSRTFVMNNVVSAGSPATTNICYPSSAFGNNTYGGAINIGFNMAEGDFINFNVDDGTGTQYAWVNVAEIANP